jgi:multiple sugar transport system permease protein
MVHRNRVGRLFLLPGVIWVLCFTLFPLLYSLYLSFTNKRIGRRNRATEWIGTENYAEILSDNRVSEVLEMTVFIVLGSVILTVILGTFIAWLFNHEIPGLRAFRAILTLPIFAAPIALGQLGMILFNEQSGPINHMITGLGADRLLDHRSLVGTLRGAHCGCVAVDAVCVHYRVSGNAVCAG